jgi:hypothetical protein
MNVRITDFPVSPEARRRAARPLFFCDVAGLHGEMSLRPVFFRIGTQAMDSEKPIDQFVEYLLRDQDFLLSEEIKHKVKELNQMLVKANGRRIKVELKLSQFDVEQDGTVAYLDVRVFKQI